QSLYSLMDNVAELREDHNPDLDVEGIVINQFNAQARLPGELVAELEGEGYPVFATYLTTSVKMKESHREHRPLIDMAPSHKLTGQFLDLHAELEKTAARAAA
ncbi:MAG: ParA family protein, partial [Halioglobus sp.]|nr:ParA family protein [Halioglobus sp.]